MPSDLRIGTLGAARITPMALIWPARHVAGASVTAVAARSRARAEKFARKHGIEKVHDDYDSLLADPEIDAVYNPLPNSLHAEWTLRALDAGKHVLCEKPFTSNALEAERVHLAAERSDRIVMEAFPKKATYAYQLEAFRDAVVDGKPFITTTADAVKTMKVVDAVYRAAGLEPRKDDASHCPRGQGADA